jgi:hypothetical protein
MDIYIASALKNADMVRQVRDALVAKGHKITYDWTVHGLVEDTSLLQEIANKEFQGVIQCDALVVLWPAGFGTHIELGIALASGKPVHFYLPEVSLEMKSFYYMKNVTRYIDLNDLIAKF